MTEPTRWQPIETAPKDGTAFLAWGEPYRYLCRWSDKWKDWVCDHDGDPMGPNYMPTHWMPLPPPPEPKT